MERTGALLATVTFTGETLQAAQSQLSTRMHHGNTVYVAPPGARSALERQLELFATSGVNNHLYRPANGSGAPGRGVGRVLVPTPHIRTLRITGKDVVSTLLGRPSITAQPTSQM